MKHTRKYDHHDVCINVLTQETVRVRHGIRVEQEHDEFMTWLAANSGKVRHNDKANKIVVDI